MRVEELCGSFRNDLDSANFFSRYAGVKYHKFDKGLELRSLFDERDLEACIRFMPEESVHQNQVNLVFSGLGVNLDSIKRNGVLDYEQFLRVHDGGATIILNGLDNFANPLYYWSKYLEGIFEGRVQANFYGTPSNARGFNPHVDDHDVIVLQVKGEKDWTFYELMEGSPNVVKKAYTMEEVRVVDELRLEKEGALYIPRGHLHSAKTGNQGSWHLTIGISGYYWSDYLKNIIDSSTLSITDLQRFVKVGSSDSGALKKEAKAIFEQFVRKDFLEEEIRKYEKRYPNLGKFLDQIDLIDSAQLAQLDEHMTFAMSESAKSGLKTDEHGISMNLPYRREPLKLHSRTAKALDYIATHSEFAPKKLPGLASLEESVLLTYFLWNNGMIETVN